MTFRQHFFLALFIVTVALLFLIRLPFRYSELKAKTEIDFDFKVIETERQQLGFNAKNIVSKDLLKVQPPPVAPSLPQPIVKPPPPPKPVPPPPPPARKLPLQLQGVIVDESRSTAFILNTNSKESTVFAVGDEVMSGVRLVEIYEHRVILNDRGQDVELIEEGYSDALSKLLSEKGAAFDGGSSGSEVTYVDHQEPTNYEVTTIDDKVYVTQQEVQKQVQSLGSLISQVRVRPHIVRGRPKGFQIMHVRAGSFVQAAGIQAGDIITHVNGKVVDTQQRAYEIFNGIQHDSQVDITIIRNNQEKNISYEMR